jgi:hypothetical protein
VSSTDIEEVVEHADGGGLLTGLQREYFLDQQRAIQESLSLNPPELLRPAGRNARELSISIRRALSRR